MTGMKMLIRLFISSSASCSIIITTSSHSFLLC